MTDPLVARFEALLEPGRPDWADVRRRARRSRRPLLLAAAALALFVAAPAVAIAVRSGVLSWGDAEPAPPAIVERFSAHERAVKVATARYARIQSQAAVDLGILSAQARRIPLMDGTVAYVAPERSGGFCAFFENPADPGIAYAQDCGAGRSPGPISSLAYGNEKFGNYVLGHVDAAPSSSVEIVLDDGSVLDVPVTWIGPPIDAGLFIARLGPDRRAYAVVLRDPDGRTLARDGHLGSGYEQMQKLLDQAKQGRSPAAPGSHSPQPGAAVSPGG